MTTEQAYYVLRDHTKDAPLKIRKYVRQSWLFKVPHEAKPISWQSGFFWDTSLEGPAFWNFVEVKDWEEADYIARKANWWGVEGYALEKKTKPQTTKQPSRPMWRKLVDALISKLNKL
jgi:hypothetical protein